MTSVAQTPNPKESAMTMTEAQQKAYWQAILDRHAAEAEVAWENLVAQSRASGAARTQPVQTGEGVGLIVNSVSYGQEREGLLEEIIAKTAEPVGLVATQDGRGYVNAWHEGPSDIEGWVFFERYENGGRVAHGYIDPVSRKIVQTG